ncbi:polyphosphate polymerase domain-containing protein [Pelagicoccus albus]|nr:polyphosphate polymerase domain-containing protein [Pelagicoccus albus]
MIGLGQGSVAGPDGKPLVIVPRVRHEFKYIVPASMADDIRAYVQMFCEKDPNAVGHPPSYTVSTLQLDSPSLSLHFAKERKLVNRFKLRVRTYGTDLNGTVFFEVKRKETDYVCKTRSRVSMSEYRDELYTDPNCIPHFATEEETRNHIEFLRLSRSIGARPVLHIRYDRESWIGTEDRSVRVTMDRNLRYRKAEGYRFFGAEPTGWRVMDTEVGLRRPFAGMILEVKSALGVPVWIPTMIRHFGLVRSGFCKYSTAMRLESLFGGGSYSATSERCHF